MAIELARLRQLAVNESGFVFDPVSGHTFTVNQTGLAIITALKQGVAPVELAGRLADEFELEGGEDLSRDVDDFIARLREQGLVA